MYQFHLGKFNMTVQMGKDWEVRLFENHSISKTQLLLHVWVFTCSTQVTFFPIHDATTVKKKIERGDNKPVTCPARGAFRRLTSRADLLRRVR